MKKTFSKYQDPLEIVRQVDLLEESKRFREAFQLLCEAARLGQPCAQLNLGNYYANGTGVRRNLTRAEYFYKQAFKNGCATAARNLAIDKLAVGNVQSARFWLRKAVEAKDGASFVLLARLYAERRGGDIKAQKLLRRVSRLSADHASEMDKQNARSLLRKIRGK